MTTKDNTLDIPSFAMIWGSVAREAALNQLRHYSNIIRIQTSIHLSFFQRLTRPKHCQTTAVMKLGDSSPNIHQLMLAKNETRVSTCSREPLVWLPLFAREDRLFFSSDDASRRFRHNWDSIPVFGLVPLSRTLEFEEVNTSLA